MLREAAKANVTAIFKDPKVTPAVEKIIIETVKEEIQNILNTCKENQCNFGSLVANIHRSLETKTQNQVNVFCGSDIGQFSANFASYYAFTISPVRFAIEFYKPFKL
jgi:hypothetical protein